MAKKKLNKVKEDNFQSNKQLDDNKEQSIEQICRFSFIFRPGIELIKFFCIIVTHFQEKCFDLETKYSNKCEHLNSLEREIYLTRV